MNEFELIAQYFAPLTAGEPGARNLTDDAALLDVPPGETLVATHDVMIEAVHFTGKEPPHNIARKLLRVNLSDLAAMGAKPCAYLLGIAAPRRTQAAWFKDFADGLAQDQAEFGIALAGGDTTAHDGALNLSLTALGTLPQGAALTRAGAQIGDDLYVSGTLGDAGLGLALATGAISAADAGATAFLKTRYELPSPRITLGLALRGIAHAAMDISDGLMQDLSHICRASGVGARVEVARVPLSPAARAMQSAQTDVASYALSAGDDYELLFTAPARARGAIEALSTALELPIARIGAIAAGSGATAYDQAGNPFHLATQGFCHFA